MPIQNSGKISVTDIVEEFSSRLPVDIANFNNITLTDLVNVMGDMIGKSPSDEISFADFYGLSNYRILLANNTFEVITTYSTIIPVASILSGSVDEWSGNLDPLALISVQSPINGTVVLNGSNVEFTSTSDGLGIDAAGFSYTVRNSSNINETGTVSMTVLAIPPIITIPDTLSVRQGETLLTSASNLSNNDIDGQGRALTVTGVSNPVGGTVLLTSGTIEFNSTGLSGEPASFDYTITNGTEIETGKAYITITPLPEKPSLVYWDADEALAATQVISPPSQADVFNSWDRFDGSGYYPGGTTPGGQAADWTLSQNPTRIVQPTNTSSGGGFVSPDKYNDYVFSANVRSDAAGDNDTIGLIAAFTRDGSTNKTLVAARTKGGQEPSNHWGVFYTENGPWTPTWMIASSDMTAGSTASTWAPDYTRIKIQRQGDIITFYTTNWNDVDNFQISSEIVVDLSSDARLASFMGESPYGYYSHSQGGSTYFDVEFNGGLDGETILDAETPAVYLWNGAGWDLSTGPDAVTIQDSIGYIRKVDNPVTGGRFIIKETNVEYLGLLTSMTNLNSSKILNETQHLLINTSTSSVGASNNVRIVGLYETGKEEKNLLSGLPNLNTYSAFDSNNGSTFNSIASTYFNENNLDIVTLQLIDGVVVFDDGIVGKITAVTYNTISYEPSDDFNLWDEGE